jgi:hypothetical protein
VPKPVPKQSIRAEAKQRQTTEVGGLQPLRKSPLTDSNRRPPPYHALVAPSGRNPRQGFWLDFPAFAPQRFATGCHRLQTGGSIRAPYLVVTIGRLLLQRTCADQRDSATDRPRSVPRARFGKSSAESADSRGTTSSSSLGEPAPSVSSRRGGAEESSRAAAAWLKENLPDRNVQAPYVTAGDVVLSSNRAAVGVVRGHWGK